MATQTRDVMRLKGESYVDKIPEAASQTFKKGDLLKIDGNGRCAIYAAASAAGSTSDTFLGIAMQDASGTTDTLLDVEIPCGDYTLVLPVYHGTPASAVTAEAKKNTTCNIHNLAGAFCVAIDNTTNPAFLITGIDPTDAVGTQYGRYEGRFLAAYALGTK